jgi:glycosyltransferase involved in cell wall biosynthesis
VLQRVTPAGLSGKIQMHLINMRILILFEGQFPGPSAGAKRIDYYQKGLKQTGVSAMVLPIGNKSNGRISFYWNQMVTPFIAAQTFYKKRKKCNILFLYGFGWLSYLLLSVIAKTYGVKIYLEVNEKPGSVYGSVFTEIRLIKFISTKLIEFAFRFFDGFVVISAALEIYLKPFVVRGAKLVTIPIIIDLKRDSGLTIKPDAHFPYILHTGALSDQKDGIGEMLEAFAIACKSLNKQVHIYFTSKVATSNLLEHIERVIAENGLQQNVHFLGDISEEKLLSFQKFCSMVIINKNVNEQNLHNFPTKLGEYLAFGIPVITTAIGEMGKYLKDGDNAFIVPLHNIQAMAEKIVYVLQHPEESAMVGGRGKETASVHFDYLIQGKRLAKFFKENGVK